MQKTIILALLALLLAAGCSIEEVQVGEVNTPSGGTTTGETGRVIRVIDGDTIDVEINGQEERIRYVGVNTPERGEACYSEATAANRRLVEGATVRLERDVNNRDRFDRLLRYVYVGDTFVNATLIREGYAEAVLYRPDDREFERFRQLEEQAEAAGIGCHPTGIFDDGNPER
ncbi:MAG: thermonuclease family protein [Chloroflexota bacterium]